MNTSTVVAIIQARMGSSRFPGKTLAELGGSPVIEWVVTWASLSQFVDRVVVATTTSPIDNPLVSWCDEHDVPVFRGATDDVLDRFYFEYTRLGCEVKVSHFAPK